MVMTHRPVAHSEWVQPYSPPTGVNSLPKRTRSLALEYRCLKVDPLVCQDASAIGQLIKHFPHLIGQFTKIWQLFERLENCTCNEVVRITKTNIHKFIA